MSTAPTRDDVLRVARSWLDTPYHHCTALKGVGVDCAMILVSIFSWELKITPYFDPRPYKPQWFLHKDEPIYLNWLAKFARQVERPEPGDVMMFNFGRHAAHGAIVLEDCQSIIHAYMPLGRVIVDDSKRFAVSDHCGGLHSCWSPF